MADSIFPFINASVTDSTATETEMPKEYAWDFEKNEFKFIDGKVQVVEGLEAIKIKVYKALITQRYRYLIYSWDYGSELEQLIGQRYSKELTNAEALRFTQDTLKVYIDKGWITAIKDFVATFSDDELSISFTIVTPYGEASINV
ncbi:MAG TPA: DUF2634 domain-containing protein [Thermoanaerobacterium sp.]|nr:DUF2634 domain-containing protein [Thermoanaerobacterium sp.]